MVKATRFSRRIILFSMPAPPAVQKMFCVKVRDTVVPRFVQENALIAAGLLFFLRMHPSAAEAKNIASYRAVGVFSKRVGYQLDLWRRLRFVHPGPEFDRASRRCAHRDAH